jgi:hypothetical protein
MRDFTGTAGALVPEPCRCIIAAVEGNGGITGLSAIDIVAVTRVFLPLVLSNIFPFVRSGALQCADAPDQSAE